MFFTDILSKYFWCNFYRVLLKNCRFHSITYRKIKNFLILLWRTMIAFWMNIPAFQHRKTKCFWLIFKIKKKWTTSHWNAGYNFWLYENLCFNKKSSETSYNDVSDGSEYHRLIIKNVNYKTITVVYDEFQTFWPFIAYINKLPVSMRYKFAMILSLQTEKIKGSKIFQILIHELIQIDKKPW